MGKRSSSEAVAWLLFSAGGVVSALLAPVLLLLFGVVYFLMIRPQQKRQRDLELQIKAIEKNDHVVTAGGLRGKVVGIADDVLTIEIATLKGGESVRVKISRAKVESVTKVKKDEES